MLGGWGWEGGKCGGSQESDLSAAAADMQTAWQLLQLNRVRQIGRSLRRNTRSFKTTVLSVIDA